jgi:methyl-accepting chemotaxis protein
VIRFKDLSMKTKIVVSLVPMIACSLLVSFHIYKTGLNEDTTLERAIAITDTVAHQELQMVTMSEALRGYILDPKNTKEYERKKEADKLYGEYSEKLGTLTKDNKEIHELNEAMAKLDEDELDKKETQVAALVNEDRSKVLEYFTKEYMPVRIKQNTNFIKLKELSTKYSKDIIAAINHQKKVEAIWSMILVLSGTFIGSFVIYYVNHSVNKDASSIFDSIYMLSDRLTETAKNLSLKSQELSEATTEEASAIQETASSLHEVTAMVQRNTDNANKSRDLSLASRDASHYGLESVQKMLTAMEDINTTQGDIINRVDDGNKKISDIVNVISAIGEKTKVINDIVFQTKLLSFNASVEAARAGEQGKGFAVVAEEVGNLATMSGKAAQEITEMLDESIKRVSSIVDETKTNVEKIVYQGKDKISSGTQIASDCAQSLEDVVKKIEEVDKTIGDITVASKEQSQGIAEINSAVSQLDQTTQQNSAIANETFRSSKELSEKSDDLRKMVDSLVVIFRGTKV